MAGHGLITSIGPVMQLAFVPNDFETALLHWTQKMGVGPFFWIKHADLENTRFLGEKSDLDFGVALSYWGDIQIELIVQHNDAPSIYKTAPYARSGLHHICVLTDDIAEARSITRKSGAEIVFEADVPGGGAVFYADLEGEEGLIEMLQTSPGSNDIFDMMKKTALRWNGKDPLRTL